MEFLQLAEHRYSCRLFTDRKVDPADIQKILHAGILAPTAVNRQPVKIWVMESDQAKEAIHACTTCTFGADTFFVVGAKPEEAWVRPFDQRNFGDVDASIVATHMMLEVESLGLGTTWVGFFDAPKLKAFFPEMEGYDLVAIFPVGYPSEEEKGQPSARHSQRNPHIVASL